LRPFAIGPRTELAKTVDEPLTEQVFQRRSHEHFNNHFRLSLEAVDR
jgi:hypothetical protein